MLELVQLRLLAVRLVTQLLLRGPVATLERATTADSVLAATQPSTRREATWQQPLLLGRNLEVEEEAEVGLVLHHLL